MNTDGIQIESYCAVSATFVFCKIRKAMRNIFIDSSGMFSDYRYDSFTSEYRTPAL